jgi:hypothetical protein
MGFHKRFITNKQIIDLFESGKITEIIKLYTSGVDVIIADAGLSSKLLDIIYDDKCDKESIINVIYKELNTKE